MPDAGDREKHNSHPKEFSVLHGERQKDKKMET